MIILSTCIIVKNYYNFQNSQSKNISITYKIAGGNLKLKLPENVGHMKYIEIKNSNPQNLSPKIKYESFELPIKYSVASSIFLIAKNKRYFNEENVFFKTFPQTKGADNNLKVSFIWESNKWKYHLLVMGSKAKNTRTICRFFAVGPKHFITASGNYFGPIRSRLDPMEQFRTYFSLYTRAICKNIY